MRLKHQQDTLFIDGNRPVILLGRELGNDIVIIDPRASRQHARIERRREGFVLIDESTNGCFVAINGEEEQCLKGTALPLTGPGRFGCGFSSQEFEDDIVFFELV
jgi:predicted component of type VI protein secretion system